MMDEALSSQLPSPENRPVSALLWEERSLLGIQISVEHKKDYHVIQRNLGVQKVLACMGSCELIKNISGSDFLYVLTTFLPFYN